MLTPVSSLEPPKSHAAGKAIAKNTVQILPKRLSGKDFGGKSHFAGTA
jgi:hypothetical protein